MSCNPICAATRHERQRDTSGASKPAASRPRILRLGFVPVALVVLAGLCTPVRAQIQTQIQLVGYTTSSLSSSAVTSASITVPSGVTTGDLLLAVMSNNVGSGGSGPTGWTFIASNITTGTVIGFSIWYRIATSADVGGSTSYTWTVTNSSRMAGAMSAFRGVDNTNPIVTANTVANNTASTSRTSPSLTPGVANTTLVALYAAGNGNADTPSAPSGMTQIFAGGTTQGSSGSFISGFYSRFAAATASGTFVSTSGNSISATSDGGTVSLRPATVSPSAYWHFDEASWSGTAGEVVDSGGSGYNGVAAHGAATASVSPAISGSPGTCNYGSFNGSTQYVEMPSSLPHVGNEFTVTAWIRPTANVLGRVWMDDENYNGYGISFYDSGSAKLRLYTRNPSTVYVDSNVTLSLNTWYFVALVSDVTIAGQMYLIVFDSSGNTLGTVSLNRSSFSAGSGAHATVGGSDDGETQGTLAHFAGNIDEVTIFQYDIPVPSLQVWAQTTHPCPSAASNFKITNSNYGIYCAPQSVTVTVYDASGNPYSGYTGSIALSTTTGKGTWTLTTGSGTFSDPTPDDGAATYTFPGTQSAATFSLSYQDGAATVTVHATQSTPTVVNDDGTQGAIVFSPSGFTVTSSAFSNPSGGIPAFASPQVAGNNFSVYLTAYGTTPTSNTCGIITTYTGAKNLKFWSTYVNPSTGTVSATINGTSIATAEANSVAQSVTFSNGQATVTAKYKDAGSLSLSMKDDTTGNPNLPTGIRGSTGTFVSQPANFVVSNIKRTSDSFANPAASTATGTVFIAAGQPFTATVTAVEAGGTATPNFGQESPAESVKLVPALVLPVTGNDPALGGSFGSFSGGVATGTAFSWAEVGIIQLSPQVYDGNYLGSGNVIGSSTGNVGRFIPNGFGVSLNTPLFATSCTSGGFTYMGQPFTYAVAPVITATAQALGGTTTQNYAGSFFRLTNASVTGRSYTPTPASPALTLTGLPATTADPTIVSSGSGVATLTFSAGTGISFTRGSAIPPFAANIALSINVIDLDGVAATNPVTFGSGSGIGFSAGANQYYGRTAIRSVLGSELLDLPMPLTNQYYVNATSGFTTNTADNCSVAPGIAFSNYQVNLSAGETCVRDSGSPGVSGAGCSTAAAASSQYYGTANAGNYNLNLAAPGSGNNGAVTVTAAPPAWLQYLWNNASGTNSNPAGIATFGVFPGQTSRIYQREVY